MKKQTFTKFLIYLMVFALVALTGCSNAAAPVAKEVNENADFDALVAQAKGTTVTFYGWGGDELRNKWLDTVVASTLKTKYDITLKRVPMDIDQILSQLSGEKQAGKEEGSIDMIWINGENFFSAKENGFLYGSFTDKLPNYDKYIDQNSEENQYDFGYPIEGYEAPYSKAQMVLINDSAVTPETPKNTEELLVYAKKYPGKVTYPALPDFTGSAFVRTIIYDIVGYEQFMTMEADKETVKAAILPALEYLKELNPYLWNEGKTFPATSSQVMNMFSDGELVMNMSYGPYSVATSIEAGIYPKTARTFLFDKGTVGNTNYIAIAANSPNKAGAMVAINEIISVELQASQFSELKDLPVVAYDKLTAEEKTKFDSVDTGKGTLPQDELLAKRLPEMPAKLVPIIEEIWLEEVVGQ
ncbi:ABC transporter substrate-binding protein [Desulfitobacterium sp. PCE1]|uniref:ABC transporter substrate-binding protein n=1 Tax=Desulfitobacterium sp. PCE1 TaxID=146907 RepID=UPI00036708E0|nr:ABC transporter substrate-binding protein [Desulfitobacterium sp. PCE1]